MYKCEPNFVLYVLPFFKSDAVCLFLKTFLVLILINLIKRSNRSPLIVFCLQFSDGCQIRYLDNNCLHVQKYCNGAYIAVNMAVTGFGSLSVSCWFVRILFFSSLCNKLLLHLLCDRDETW